MPPGAAREALGSGGVGRQDRAELRPPLAVGVRGLLHAPSPVVRAHRRLRRRRLPLGRAATAGSDNERLTEDEAYLPKLARRAATHAPKIDIDFSFRGVAQLRASEIERDGVERNAARCGRGLNDERESVLRISN